MIRNLEKSVQPILELVFLLLIGFVLVAQLAYFIYTLYSFVVLAIQRFLWCRCKESDRKADAWLNVNQVKPDLCRVCWDVLCE